MIVYRCDRCRCEITPLRHGTSIVVVNFSAIGHHAEVGVTVCEACYRRIYEEARRMLEPREWEAQPQPWAVRPSQESPLPPLPPEG